MAIGGLSGTGKSALSGRLAPLIGRSPGAAWLRSDIERKRLLGVAETDRLPREAYNKASGREVYAELRRKARLALKAGHSVLLDAVHANHEERDGAERLSAELGVPFSGLWLEAPIATRLARVARRTNDASDADGAVARAQTADGPSEAGWRSLDASADIAAVTQAAYESLGSSQR